MKRESVSIKDLIEQATFTEPDGFRWLDKRRFTELIGHEVLNLANRHGNIKPRDVEKYFDLKERK